MMKRFIRVICLVFVACLFAPLIASAQDKPTLMVLGSAHFGNPGRDAINREVEDVLSERRQAEMEILTQQLARFMPTHIAVELPGRLQAELDQRYADYRAGAYQLTRNEADQLGMRLAAQLGHDRIFAVDWNGNPPGDSANYDWPAFARAHGQDAVVTGLLERAALFSPELGEQTLSEWLQRLNAPDNVSGSHAVYVDIGKVGEGDELIGANWVGTWYARNLKIYSRLAALPAGPGDRVLVIYGQAHAYLLQQLAREDDVFNVVGVEQLFDGQ